MPISLSATKSAIAGSPDPGLDGSARIALLVGWAALAFSGLYWLSDLIEFAQGGFSTPQLALTYAAEAAIPLFILGLFAVQRPRIGALGLVGAVTYAYTFVFFTGTVVYALANRTSDWDELTTQLGAWVTVHSVLMILAGIIFGVAVVRAHVLPRWTGVTLVAGMIMMAVTAGLPKVTQTMSAGIRDLAFAGMGVALLRRVARRTIGEIGPEPGAAPRPSDASALAVDAHQEHAYGASSSTGAPR